jgi:hypothetical protein
VSSMAKRFQTVRLSREFDVRGVGVGLGSGFAFFAEFLKAKGNGAPEFAFGFRPRGAGGDAGWEVGRVGGVACAGFFDDNEIFFHGECGAFFDATPTE